MLSDPNAQILEESQLPATKTTTLILNRPRALHALSAEMCSALYGRLQEIERSTNINCVLFRSQGTDGHAFCSGGDVRAFHAIKEAEEAECSVEADSFFRTEYQLDSWLGSMKRAAVVSLWDGIVMGGGVGLSVHGAVRIATEHTVFAMPECVIGLHPDVGASFVLSRLLQSGLGAFLSLTGARLTGRQVLDAGLATHFIASQALDALVSELVKTDLPDIPAVHTVLDKHCTKANPTHSANEILRPNVLKSCFTYDNVSAVTQALQKTVNNADDQLDRDFAGDALKMMNAGSPTSVKVALRAFQEARKMDSLDKCLKMDYRLITRFTRRRDFHIGVRSALVTKDRNPIWEPQNFGDVSDEDVDRMFRPLKSDLGIAELYLGHDSEGPALVRSRL